VIVALLLCGGAISMTTKKETRNIPSRTRDQFPLEYIEIIHSFTGTFGEQPLFLLDHFLGDIIHAYEINDGEWFTKKAYNIGLLLCILITFIDSFDAILKINGHRYAIYDVVQFFIPFIPDDIAGKDKLLLRYGQKAVTND
jgi:hypothetical protein